MPESWAQDAERRKQAQVPEEVIQQTKPEIALGLLDRAREWGVPIQTVVVDAGYGDNPNFLRGLDERQVPYMCAVESTSENFLRPETLKAANDCISNAIAALAIFRHYDIANVVHSSSDGQKFETALPTFNARYSPKYFGLNKGVVAYTLVANHVPVNADMIGAHDAEYHRPQTQLLCSKKQDVPGFVGI